MSFVLHGIGVTGGIAIGRAQLVSHATLEVAHYAIRPEQVPAEIARLTQAIQAVQKELEGLHGAMTSGDAPAEFGAFLDVIKDGDALAGMKAGGGGALLLTDLSLP